MRTARVEVVDALGADVVWDLEILMGMSNTARVILANALLTADNISYLDEWHSVWSDHKGNRLLVSEMTNEQIAAVLRQMRRQPKKRRGRNWQGYWDRLHMEQLLRRLGGRRKLRVDPAVARGQHGWHLGRPRQAR